MVWRPFYFANLIVDPKDENKVFKPDGPLMLSVNGGKSFSSVANAHGDFHDLWINPADPNIVYRGRRWRNVVQRRRRHALENT